MKIKFGQFKGKSLEEIYDIKKDYLFWLLEQNFTRENLKEAINKVLDKKEILIEKKVEDLENVGDFIFIQGKHKRKRLSKVASEDFSYLVYLKDANFEGEAKKAVTKFFEDFEIVEGFQSEYLENENESYEKEGYELIFVDRKESDGFISSKAFYKKL